MTRPPSTPGFAQFFPTAPKVRAEAKGRGDRERSRSSINGIEPSQDSSSEHDSQTHVGTLSNGRTSSDAPHSHFQNRPDENESPHGDIPGTGDSASSYASTVSSVFSSARAATTYPPSRYSTASATPITKDSPSSSLSAGINKTEMPPSMLNDNTKDKVSHILDHNHNDFASSKDPSTERVPPWDTSSSVKGIKCTFDPFLERLHNKGVSRSAKPTYKEFGSVCIKRSSLLIQERGVVSCMKVDN